jgi:hypothetical protein
VCGWVCSNGLGIAADATAWAATEAERSLRSVAARPEERDEEKNGRHFVRDDRWLPGTPRGIGSLGSADKRPALAAVDVRCY